MCCPSLSFETVTILSTAPGKLTYFGKGLPLDFIGAHPSPLKGATKEKAP
jgi:hypothetical protein